jgi:hypoxanthine phosphoribosyltransferase
VIEHRIYLTKLYSLRAIISLSGNVNTDIINLDTLVGIAKYQKNWKSVLYDWNESEKQIDWDAVYWSIKSRGVNQNKPTQEQIDKFKNIYLEASKELMEKYENCKKLFEGAIEILKRHWIEDRINEYGQCISDTGNTLDMSEKDLEASFRNDIIDAESFWDVQE